MKSAGFLLSLVALVIFAFGMVPCMGWLMIPAFIVAGIALILNLVVILGRADNKGNNWLGIVFCFIVFIVGYYRLTWLYWLLKSYPGQ